MSELPRVLLALAGAALLAGCALRGDLREPQPLPSEPFVAASPALTRPAAVQADWWQLYQDPVLTELVVEALDVNRQVEAAVARLEAARSRVRESRQGHAPYDGLSAGHRREELSVSEGGARNQRFHLGVEASWEADLFGRVRASVVAARAREELAEADLDGVRLSIAVEAAQLYFDWRGTRQRLRLHEAYVRDQSKLVELVQARIAGGMAVPADLHRARAQLAADRAAQLADRHRARSLEYALAVLLARRPGDWLAPEAEALVPLTLHAVPIADPEALLQRRPDVVAARRRLVAATADIDIVAAELFPRVKISGFLGYAAGNPAALGDGGADAWTVLPTIHWGVFQLGRVRARIRGAEAEQQALVAEYEHTVLRALAETEDALSGLGTAQAVLAEGATRTAHARRAADLARLQFEEGASDYFRVLDAARDAREAELGLVAALVAQRSATLLLHKALGVPQPPRLAATADEA